MNTFFENDRENRSFSFDAVAPSRRYVTFRTILFVAPEQWGKTAKQWAHEEGNTDCLAVFKKHGY